MWTYDQSSGELYKDGKFISKGYSGKARGKNNPALQGLQGVGPIPRGKWRLVRVYNSKNVGPFAIVLYSLNDSVFDDRDEKTGRSAFRIHGDSIRAPGTASRGCIILPRAIRERMWNSKDHELLVVE